jgi:hypothetical protein
MCSVKITFFMQSFHDETQNTGQLYFGDVWFLEVESAVNDTFRLGLGHMYGQGSNLILYGRCGTLISCVSA